MGGPNLSDRVTIHATLVSVFGEGVLIRGDSGSGKTRLALGLIGRGHKLIADDSVQLSLRRARLWGNAPLATAGLLEFKGRGIFKVSSADDPSVVLQGSTISVCVLLRRDDAEQGQDPSGRYSVTEFLGETLPACVIEVGSGWAEPDRVERFVQGCSVD